jgi:hypothetical protein
MGKKLVIAAYFLLCVRTSAGPFGDNIFLGLIVCRKSKSHTRESCTLKKVNWSVIASPNDCRMCYRDGASRRETYKINADNQLGLAPAVALDLGGSVACVRRDRTGGLRCWRGVSSAASIPRRASRERRGRAAHDGWWVPSNRRAPGVDGRRTTDHLRWRRASRTLVCQRAGTSNGTRRAWWRVASCRIAGWSWTSAWVVHLEAGLR